MKASEILRKFADLLDQQESGQDTASSQTELIPVTTDNSDDTETSTMVPPLQQKLELLKKTAGVDSHYDDENCEHDADDESDPLDQMKKMAGISPVVMTVAGDDNDVAG